MKYIQIIAIAILITTFIPAVLAQQNKQIEFKIYLQKDVDLPNKMVRTDWVTIKRTGEANSPLRSALEWLFNPQLTPEEEKQKLYEIDFGMKFEGVSLKNGTATVRFSETDIANYRPSSAGIFVAAVTKTTKQFPGVKRVKICAVGETSFDLESGKRLFYPCK